MLQPCYHAFFSLSRVAYCYLDSSFFIHACRNRPMTNGNNNNNKCIKFALQLYELLCKHCGQRLQSKGWQKRTIKMTNESTDRVERLSIEFQRVQYVDEGSLTTTRWSIQRQYPALPSERCNIQLISQLLFSHSGMKRSTPSSRYINRQVSRYLLPIIYTNVTLY